MPKVTFDANVFIRHKDVRTPPGFYLSAVVVQELAAGAHSEKEIKALGAVLQKAEKAERLLVPTGEDWWMVGKVIYSLQRRVRSKKTGDIPKMTPEEKFRIVNDVLIARTAKREGVVVVTYNMRDFEKIRDFCAVKVWPAADYFRAG